MVLLLVLLRGLPGLGFLLRFPDVVEDHVIYVETFRGDRNDLDVVDRTVVFLDMLDELVRLGVDFLGELFVVSSAVEGEGLDLGVQGLDIAVDVSAGINHVVSPLLSSFTCWWEL